MEQVVVNWSCMTDAEKRIAIAEDVLLQLDKGKYIARKGLYILDVIDETGKIFEPDQDIKKNFDGIRNCEVCAIGATILSCTHFANELTFGDVGSSIRLINNAKTRKLLSIFDDNQLLLIESAFEGHDYDADRFGRAAFDQHLDRDERERCDAFFYRYIDDSRERLEAIMENIIENNGTFIP
jgi:hypothetical protein